ncbi:putative leader peptide [Microbispora sp. NPDC049125]
MTRNLLFARLHVDLCRLAGGLCRPDGSPPRSRP